MSSDVQAVDQDRITCVGAAIWVSTRYRQSSALTESPPWYWETMAFHRDKPGILWQSAARIEREAVRQHDLAVCWLRRER